jgi:hypothetical protein
MYTHIAVNHNMYINFNVIYPQGDLFFLFKKVKNQIVTLSLTHSPPSHNNDIIQSVPSDGRKLKHILRNKIFLLVVIP